MKNIEKYKDFVFANLGYCGLESDLSGEGVKPVKCNDISCTECGERWRKWLMEEYKEPILNKAEREYLSAIIKPFRCEVECISKETGYAAVGHRIKIVVRPFDRACLERIILPNFETDIYKGMELGRKYTLEELGL